MAASLLSGIIRQRGRFLEDKPEDVPRAPSFPVKELLGAHVDRPGIPFQLLRQQMLRRQIDIRSILTPC